MTDSNSTSTKICSKCHRELPLNYYFKHSQGRLGVRPDCKDCFRKYRRAYYLAHQQKLRAYSTKYYQNNKEQTLQRMKTYSTLNKERIVSYSKQWRAANRDSLLVKKRQHYKANKEHYNQLGRKNWHANKERNAANRKQYEVANPDIVRFHKMQHEARKRNAPGTCTSEQWRQKCKYHGWRCVYCKASLTHTSVTIEHRKPLSRGGSNWPANLGPCCRACNQSKNNKSESEYRFYIWSQKFPTVSVAALDVIP